MNPRRWFATFASRPAQYTHIDELAWLLCGWSIFYATLLLLFPVLPMLWQEGIRYAPLTVMLGSSIVLVAALRQAHPEHRRSYRLACSALLLTQVLNIFAILGVVRPFTVGGIPALADGFLLYVLVYTSLIYSIGFFVPFWRFPRIDVLRISIDAALVMALSDVLIRLLLPALIPTWEWNAPLLACAFRLETTLGLFFWYARLFFRFGRPTVIPIRLWLIGFACLLINDALVLWSTFLVQYDQNLVRAAIPFWMLNQTLWALALYRNRQTPILWLDESASDLATSYPPLWHQVMRLVVTMTTLVVVVATGPAFTSMLWFFCALLSRELLTLFERERVVAAERRARTDLSERHRELAEAHAELLQTQQRLSHANAQLQQNSRFQSEQLEWRQITAAEIAHDMGNILQAVKVTLSLVEATLETGDPELSARLERYLHTADVALRMSENLLSTMVAAAQYDAGVFQLNTEPIEPVSLLEEVVEHQQLRARGRPVEIELIVPATLPLINGDPILLTRALLNIVGNAVKYTSGFRRDGSARVIIGSSVEGSRLRLSVEDNGPGIPPETVARLGQRFVRGVEGPNAPAGFGVGLSFSRVVIEQHPGGRLMIESEVGCGTTIVVELEIMGEITPAQSREVGR